MARLDETRRVIWSTYVTSRPTKQPDIVNLRLIDFPTVAETDVKYYFKIAYDVVNGDFPGGVLVQISNSSSSPGNIIVETDSGWVPVAPGSTVNITTMPGAEGHYTVPTGIEFTKAGNYTGEVIVIGQLSEHNVVVRRLRYGVLNLPSRKVLIIVGTVLTACAVGGLIYLYHKSK